MVSIDTSGKAIRKPESTGFLPTSQETKAMTNAEMKILNIKNII